jgi:hypothetical protein
MIDDIIKDSRKCNRFITKELCVELITGPMRMTNVVKKTKNSTTVLDNKYYEPCSNGNKGCKIGKDSIMDHKHEGSWLSSSNKWISKVLDFILKNIVYIILVFIVLYIYKYHSKYIVSFKKYRKFL